MPDELTLLGRPAPAAQTGPADPRVRRALPASGPGYYCKDPGRAYGRAGTLQAVTAIAAEWHRRHPAGPRLGITDISLPGGGPIPPHRGHRHGTEVDIRPVRGDGREGPVSCAMPGYSRRLTQELVGIIRGNPVLPVAKIYFNDPQITGVSPRAGHDNHLHVRFGAVPAAAWAARPAPGPAARLADALAAVPAAALAAVPAPLPTAAPAGVPAAVPAPVPAAARATVRAGVPAAVPPGVPADVAGARLGTLVSPVPGGGRFDYPFTPDDLLWTARFLCGATGGRNNLDNRAVLWTVFNIYGYARHRRYPTFHAFLRAYSTPLQEVLRSWRAARRHLADPDYAATGGSYPPPAPPGIPMGQLGRFRRLQRTPWAALPAQARALATAALTGRAANPVGNATQLADTAVSYADRYHRRPHEAQWRQFTADFARGRRYRWIGGVPGLNQRRGNGFFVEDRFAALPPARIRPPAS
jgi:hypothetical protein